MMNKISVIVIAKNEEKHIEECLKSIQWSDEIIVVDDGSTDKTVEISEKYASAVYKHPIDIDFNQNRNWAIKKTTGNWILFLDADERIPPVLADEIKMAINDNKYVGYYISRKNYFVGKWIKGCGWYPDYIIRLFKKGVTLWPKEIHHTPKISYKYGRSGYLKSSINHYSYKSLWHYFIKFNRNTSRLAKESFEKGVRVNRKNSILFYFIRPCFWFFKKYFILKGFRDGFRGLFICFSSALTIFTMYAKLWEIQHWNKENIFHKDYSNY